MAAPVQTVGRYALFDEIASGGMASIHIARLMEAHGFSRTVAVKRLHAQYAKDPQFVAMFLDEARLAARIRHPNVVPTLDIVSTPAELFLVMEYVAGATLGRLAAALYQKNELIPPRTAAAIMSGVLHGLHAAHEATSDSGEPLNLVHRDVSPQNVLVGTDGVARLLDFGVAKAAGQVHTTRDGQLKGKLAYMSPEQLHSRKVDRRTDIYAAGVVLWEVLVGQRLFHGDSDGATVTKVLSAPIDPPSVARPALGDAFDACVMRALCRDVDGRYQTAKEMAAVLETLGAPQGLPGASEIGEWVLRVAGDDLKKRAARIVEIESSRTTLRSEQLTVPESDVSSISVSHTGVHPARPRRAVIAAAAFAVLGVTGLGLWLARQPRQVSAVTPQAVSEPPAAASPPPPSNVASAEISSAAASVPAQAVRVAPVVAPRHHAQPASCDPPFTYENGIKVYKSWCYGK